MERLSGRLLGVALSLLLVIAAGTSNLQAQQQPVDRSFGLTGSIQSSQTVILVPIWVSQTLNIAPGFGFSYREAVGAHFTFLLVPHFYLDMGRIAPYVSLRAGLMVDAPKRSGDQADLLGGIGFGGEYFINPKFSIGIEATVDGIIEDAGGINRIVIQSGTAVNGTVYF